jgi:hypothetical protein
VSEPAQWFRCLSRNIIQPKNDTPASLATAYRGFRRNMSGRDGLGHGLYLDESRAVGVAGRAAIIALILKPMLIGARQTDPVIHCQGSRDDAGSTATAHAAKPRRLLYLDGLRSERVRLVPREGQQFAWAAAGGRRRAAAPHAARECHAPAHSQADSTGRGGGAARGRGDRSRSRDRNERSRRSAMAGRADRTKGRPAGDDLAVYRPGLRS